MIVAYTVSEEEEKDRIVGGGGSITNDNANVQKVFRKNLNKRADKYSSSGKRDALLICFIEIDFIAKYDTTLYIVKNVNSSSCKQLLIVNIELWN